MSLPLQAIDRLFTRLSATYGREFLSRWEGLDEGAVKALWAHELAGYRDKLEALAWALENLPERAPNVIEFRNICRRSPLPQFKALPEPAADPERVKAELAKLQPLRRRSAPVIDGKDWARRILARHEAGEKILPISLRFAREAMRNRVLEPA